jgi:hypothetical protein
MHDIYSLVKKYKVNMDFLAQETSYGRTHISRVINGHMPPSGKFSKLLAMALEKYFVMALEEARETIHYMKDEKHE